ncbi:MAG: hypothetical protein IPF57_11790 [Gammaproteobacteria bacterium]|nr:hypothetical protein [Gammaproteobacteria bacterium]
MTLPVTEAGNDFADWGDDHDAVDEFNRRTAEAEEALRRRDEARRKDREQARIIGEGVPENPRIDVITPDEMIERFVFLSDGSRVFDRTHPMHTMVLADAKNAYAASKVKVAEEGAFNKDGSAKVREVPAIEVWRKSPDRLAVHGMTFNPAAGEFCLNPDGEACVNTWRAHRREGACADPQIIVDHIRWLFLDRADDFLDWLAHIEQFPGELPHTAWVHISSATGTGRGTLANVLARVWPGNTALGLDLQQMLGSGFNGRLSRKLIAIVDEIREGGGERWNHAERMKSIITRTENEINPKYGRCSMEFNCVRWLLFSNYRSAIPMADSDRRYEVMINDNRPKDLGYYKALRDAVNDPAVVLGFAMFLRERDLSGYSAGRHAKVTSAKAQVIASSRSEVAEAVIGVMVSNPRFDLFDVETLYAAAGVEKTRNGRGPAQIAAAAEEAGLVKLCRKRMNGNLTTLYVRRDSVPEWIERAAIEIPEEKVLTVTSGQSKQW